MACGGRWICIYLLLEFQSTDEPFLAVRVFDYDAGLYRQLVKALRPRRGDRLPIVLPVVVYRGQPAWRSETEVFELIEDGPAELTAYLPHLRFLLLDANAYPPEQAAAMGNPVACLFWLESSRELEVKPIEALDQLLSDPEHADLRRAFALWLTQVFLPSRLPEVTAPEVMNLEEVSPMVTEHAIDWTKPMLDKGLREGRREGEAALLLRQLCRKYGTLEPTVEERVRRADAEQIL